MAEFTKERAGKPMPILSLPRGRTAFSTTYAPKAVEIYLVIGKKPAGCAICSIPIPPGSSRLQIVARFPPDWIEVPGGNPPPAEANGRCGGGPTKQTYYLHPGCLTNRIKPEIIRFGSDCYDCGAMPPKAENARSFEEHPFRCFTVSKFAPGRLCGNCTTKPRWLSCSLCEVWFPHWMISRVTGRPDVPSNIDLDPFESVTTVRNGADVCSYCAQRWKLVTEEEAAESRSEFERLRREILEQGVFDAGDRV